MKRYTPLHTHTHNKITDQVTQALHGLPGRSSANTIHTHPQCTQAKASNHQTHPLYARTHKTNQPTIRAPVASCSQQACVDVQVCMHTPSPPTHQQPKMCAGLAGRHKTYTLAIAEGGVEQTRHAKTFPGAAANRYMSAWLELRVVASGPTHVCQGTCPAQHQRDDILSHPGQICGARAANQQQKGPLQLRLSVRRCWGYRGSRALGCCCVVNHAWQHTL